MVERERPIALCELTDFSNRAVGTLSGGERRRVALAITVAQQASVLLLDEPTAALDLRRQAEFWRLVLRLREERELAVVVVAHEINQALAVADRVVALKEGKVVHDGAPADLAQPGKLSDLYDAQLKVYQPEDGSAPRVWLDLR
jgi:ferric hydroxamate transport system ATP-binding protein